MTSAEQLAQMKDQLQTLRNALEPFASLAKKYDNRISPPATDQMLIGVTLGDLRRARVALSGGRSMRKFFDKKERARQVEQSLRSA